MQHGRSALIPVNPFDPRARPNPYPVYQYLRTVEPVHRSPVGYWILTRYDDCKAVLEDKRWSHDGDRLLEPQRQPGEPVDPLVRLIRSSIAFSDAPVHSRHRRELEAAMAPAAKGLARKAAENANQLIDLMREKDGKVELMTAYAAALPLTVLGDLVGIPRTDLRQVHQWARELAAGLDPAVQSTGVLRAGAAAMTAVEYLQDRLDDARGGKGTGMLAALGTRPSKLSSWELIADLSIFVVTGVEASCALIGNAVHALLSNPEQLQALRKKPELMATAVEELIRFDGPIHLTARVATSDIELRRAVIRKGEQAIVLLAAANRDPDRFPDPDRLDLSRAENAHLGFGAGVHTCFAASLARVLASTALSTLLQRLARIEADGEPEWSSTVTLRSLAKLPVSFAE